MVRWAAVSKAPRIPLGWVLKHGRYSGWADGRGDSRAHLLLRAHVLCTAARQPTWQPPCRGSGSHHGPAVPGGRHQWVQEAGRGARTAHCARSCFLAQAEAPHPGTPLFFTPHPQAPMPLHPRACLGGQMGVVVLLLHAVPLVRQVHAVVGLLHTVGHGVYVALVRLRVTHPGWRRGRRVRGGTV